MLQDLDKKMRCDSKGREWSTKRDNNRIHMSSWDQARKVRSLGLLRTKGRNRRVADNDHTHGLFY